MINFQSLRLCVRALISFFGNVAIYHGYPFVKFHTHFIHNRNHVFDGTFDFAALISILYSQNKSSVVMTRKQKSEQRRAKVADVNFTSWARGKPGSNWTDIMH